MTVDPKNITEETTLGELREQLSLLEVTALRLVLSDADDADDEGVIAGVHHATGFYDGTGPTQAAAIETALVKLRRTLLPEELRPYTAGE